MEGMEKRTSVGVSAFLKNDKNQFLFLNRSAQSSWGKGQWQLPEGKMEWGEAPEQTIQREVLEETCCTARELGFIGFQTVNIQARGKDFHVLRLLFKGTIAGEIRLSSEHEDFAWWALKEALKQDLTVGLKEFISQNLEKIQHS